MHSRKAIASSPTSSQPASLTDLRRRRSASSIGPMPPSLAARPKFNFHTEQQARADIQNLSMPILDATLGERDEPHPSQETECLSAEQAHAVASHPIFARHDEREKYFDILAESAELETGSVKKPMIKRLELYKAFSLVKFGSQINSKRERVMCVVLRPDR